MENIKFNALEAEQPKTQSIQAAFLENGDLILIGESTFEVVNIDNQHKDGHILIKNQLGEIKRFLADNIVEKIVVEEELDQAA